MRNKIDNKYFYWGLTIFAVVAASITLFFAFYRWQQIVDFIIYIFEVFTPILYGLLLAYILSPVLSYLEVKVFAKLGRKIFKKDRKKVKLFSRVLSISTSALLIILFLFFIINYIIPELFKSINIIITNIPDYLNNGKNWIVSKFSEQPEVQELILNNYNNIADYVIDYINNDVLPSMNTIIKNLSIGIIGILKLILNMILSFIVAIYILISKEKFIAQAKKMMYAFVSPTQGMIVLENVRYTHKVFGGFLYGKVIDSIIIGIMCFVFMILFKMPYSILISVIVGVTNIIPYFGPFIGAVPSVLLILLVSPAKAFTFLVFIFILQQFDGNILGPKILGNKTGLKSFWVLFAILIFGNLFGFIGMLFGVPLFAILYAFINGICTRRLQAKNLPAKTSEYVNIDYINPENNEVIYYK